MADRLRAAGLRAETDLASDKLGAKVRRAQMEKIPTMLVVGEKDMAARVVSPRTREGQQLPATPLAGGVKPIACANGSPSSIAASCSRSTRRAA